MSLEYALEKYPATVSLRDGTQGKIRPMRFDDAARLQKFFKAVPEPERLFIKHRVTDLRLLKSWCRNLDFERNLPLLMLDGPRVIGEATLHQRSGGWKRHIGLVTVLTHPDYRGRDVAKILVGELIEVARHLGLKELEAEFNGERKVALKAMEDFGFVQLFRLPNYVQDMQGQFHDYVMLNLSLVTDEEYASAE